MRAVLRGVAAGARAEAVQLRRSRFLVILTLLQAVTFLLLVSLFGLTGSRAPTALVDRDGGPAARRLLADLQAAHHSFALRPMGAAAAGAALRRGDLVAVITIPRGFSAAVARGRTVALPVAVDNVDIDLTDDIQRALPAAIVAFGLQSHFPGIRLRAAELDLVGHDTGFIPYLVVSALALDALVVAGILAGVATAREFEGRTAALLTLAPVPPLAPLLGRIVATGAVSLVALLITAGVVVLGYGVVPAHPLEMAAALALCVGIFSCVGMALGAALRRALPVASLVFGLSLPLYIDSGSLEPERFDGATIWALAHLSPVYYAVGVLEHAAHGLQVTPEPISLDLLALGGWALGAVVVGGLLARGWLPR
ncbi:MAG: ABC transporter permease [Chloroflexi bacterium]|nr:ABC transporter permease [Chloroflexota bacterium]